MATRNVKRTQRLLRGRSLLERVEARLDYLFKFRSVELLQFRLLYLWVALRMNGLACLVRRTTWERRVLSVLTLAILTRRIHPHLSFSSRLRKQAGSPSHFAKQVPAIRVFATELERGRFVSNQVFGVGPRSRSVAWHTCVLPEFCQLERPTGSVASR